MKTLSFVLIIGGIIFFHELGHFGACKLFSIRTPTFSLGFGPPLVQKKINDTTFQIAILPLGGYVSMNIDDLEQAPYWQKMVIILAGIMNNFILALFVFFLVAFRNRYGYKPIVRRVINHSSAHKAGIQKGDRVVRVDTTLLNDNANLLFDSIQSSPNQTVTLTIDRAGDILEIPIHIGQRLIGRNIVGFLGLEYEKKNTPQFSILTSIRHAFLTVLYCMQSSIHALTSLLRPAISQPQPLQNLIYASTSNVALFWLFAMGLMSVEIGIFNILPIPLLDGGQALFYTVQAIVGKSLLEQYPAIMHFVYLLMLVLFMLIINRRHPVPAQ